MAPAQSALFYYVLATNINLLNTNINLSMSMGSGCFRLLTLRLPVNQQNDILRVYP